MFHTGFVPCLFIAMLFMAIPASSSEHSQKAESVETGTKTGIKRDPVESDPRYKSIFKNIDAEVEQTLQDHPQRGSMGFVHLVWDTKKRILKQKYNIDWLSPAEMNPHILFD